MRRHPEMSTVHTRRWTASGLKLLLVTSALLTSIAVPAQTQATPVADRLPERLSDAEYWALVSAISEPGGYFRIEDNFTSNEREIGKLFTMLQERGTRGGVYM